MHKFRHPTSQAAACIFGPLLNCAPLRSASAISALGFGLPQLEQQRVHIFRWFSGLDQMVSEVIHSHDRQPVLGAVHVDIAFFSSHIKLASFSPIVAEEGELVECAKNYHYCV